MYSEMILPDIAIAGLKHEVPETKFLREAVGNNEVFSFY
jgi:hypothetical protein